MNKKCLNLFTIWLLLAVSSCANLPDIRSCVEISPWEARCVKMVSGEKELWNDTNLLYGDSYWSKKNIMIRLHPDEIAKLKAFFLKNCKRTKNCDEMKGQIEKLEKNLNVN